METVFLVRIVELLVESTGTLGLVVYSDLPGNQLALREARVVNASLGRRSARFRLAGTTKGKIFMWEVLTTAGAQARIYGARVYAKPMHGEWQWFTLPVEPTPEAWTAVPLPMEATPDEWTAVPLAIETTPEEWTAVRLPIAATPEMPSFIEIPVAL